jgi:transposase
MCLIRRTAICRHFEYTRFHSDHSYFHSGRSASQCTMACRRQEQGGYSCVSGCTLLGKPACSSTQSRQWLDKNSRNVAAMSWSWTIKAFNRHGGRNGCHVVLVNPDGTTRRCAQRGVESQNHLYMCEHSCPDCGFKTGRDHNASLETY